MTIFTIGFTKKSAQRFFSILTAAGVKRIVDVRLSNVTQLSGFSKRDDLSYSLAATWPSWHPRKTSSIRIASRAAAVAARAGAALRLLYSAPSPVYRLLAIASVATILEAGMALVQIATRIDSRLKQAVEEVCTQRGLKIGRFVQDALLDKLEELEDIEDLKAIRLEPTKSFSDVLSDLELDGEL